MNRCIGCGAILQTKEKEQIGFIPKDKYDHAKLCERCFRILHYNDLKVVDFPESKEVLESVNKEGSFVFFVSDLLNINTEVLNSYKKVKIPKCFVVSKVDFIPKYIKKENIKIWLREEYKIEEKIIFLSALKNQNIHSIVSVMHENQVSEAYLVGYTNTGKSTLVNRLTQEILVTTSVLPNTTLDFIKLELEENLFLIDSPGMVYENTLYDQDDVLFIKKVNPKSFIKPITYQLKKGMSLILEDYVRIENESEKCNLTLYMSNLLEMKRVYEKNNTLKDLKKVNIDIKENQDIVLKGIGFITSKSNASLTIYIKNKACMEVRNSFFGR